MKINPKFFQEAKPSQIPDTTPKELWKTKRSAERYLEHFREVTKKEEANMDKPRICEVLGVEVGERFRPKHLYNGFLSIKENGAVEFDGDPSVKDISNLILWLVCHPEDIVRIDGEKPHFTQQEVERAKAIKAIWPNAERIEHPNTSLYVYSGVNFLTKIPESTFPSIQQGQTCNIEDIIDAEKD